MRADLADEPEFAGTIFEEDEVLAEQPHAFGPAVFHLRFGADHVPVAALQLAAGRSAADAR